MLSAIHYQGHTSSELESCASMTMEAPGMLLWLLELGLKRRRGAPRGSMQSVATRSIRSLESRCISAAAVDLQKIVYTSRFVRVILAQGPC